MNFHQKIDTIYFEGSKETNQGTDTMFITEFSLEQKYESILVDLFDCNAHYFVFC